MGSIQADLFSCYLASSSDTVPAALLGLIKLPVHRFNKREELIFMGWNDGAYPEANRQDLADWGFFVRYLFFENQVAAPFGQFFCRRRIRFGQDQREFFPAKAGKKIACARGGRTQGLSDMFQTVIPLDMTVA